MCRDFIRTGCQRDHCRYFHPPQHIMAQVEGIVSMQAMAPPQVGAVACFVVDVSFVCTVYLVLKRKLSAEVVMAVPSLY